MGLAHLGPTNPKITTFNKPTIASFKIEEIRSFHTHIYTYTHTSHLKGKKKKMNKVIAKKKEKRTNYRFKTLMVRLDDMI